MNAPNKTVPELEIPEQLWHLIKYCEKPCVAECCGVNAFDFSPVHITSFMSTHSGSICEQELATWNTLIDELESNFLALQSEGTDGLICVITSMNQFFTEEAIRALNSELRTSVAASLEIMELSDRLQAPTQAWKLMEAYRSQ